MVTVQMDTLTSDGDRYETVATVELPAVPRTGEWIAHGPFWRVMRVAWDTDSGRVLTLVRMEPLYDYPQTDTHGPADPFAPENGVLGGRPEKSPSDE